jgi:hypothetical protein
VKARPFLSKGKVYRGSIAMLLFTEKSEAVAQCKEMPVVPGNKVADEKKTQRGGEAQGVANP